MERELITTLVNTRKRLGLTQQEVADRMRCSQSRVARMETLPDERLRLGDVKNYANSVGLTCVSLLKMKDVKSIID